MTEEKKVQFMPVGPYELYPMAIAIAMAEATKADVLTDAEADAICQRSEAIVSILLKGDMMVPPADGETLWTSLPRSEGIAVEERDPDNLVIGG